MNDFMDRRNGIRVDFNTEIFVSIESENKKYSCSSRDISVRGIFICTEDHLAINTLCDIEIRLGGGENEQAIVSLKGHVVRKEQNGYAVFFDSVDLESYTHLKNIVRYNAPDDTVDKT